ncbi:MAG: phosphoglycerate dehydrogenase [Planctomycetota bacterium]|nr:MAG: phosphoglycerate dehydrogenase [Planctomycetota bacterium]
MKVVLADPVAEECGRLLLDRGFEVEDLQTVPRERLGEALADAHALIVRSATQVDRGLLQLAPDLKVVGRAGSGVDNIDVDAATMQGILVMNAPGENTLSAAEHSLALLLALCRNIAPAYLQMRLGNWERSKFTGVELHGKTLGIVGLGRIGRAVASRARAFDLEVLGHDPFLPPDAAEKLAFPLLPLDTLLPQCDFLSLHVPGTEQTRHLFDWQTFQKCKPGMRLVNCARGGIVDEAAMLRALDEGYLAGAALDVFAQEPLPQDHPLRSHDQVLLTPHLGASTLEAQEKVAVRIARQVGDYLTSGSVQHAVNMPAMEPATASRLRPFQRLGEVLGRLQARMLTGSFREMRIEASGELVDLPLQALSSAVLKGFLGSVLSQPVNLVNATALARDQGFAYTEVRSHEAGDFASLLAVTLIGEEGERYLEGTLFGNQEPRLIRLDEFYVDAEPVGPMLLVVNEDRPGRLAALSSVLANYEINIANLSLGRHRASGRALALFNLDAPLPEGCLETLRAIEGVEKVLALDL